MTIQLNDNTDINYRTGDNNISVMFRSNRFYMMGNNWYFSTREGIDQGPYSSRIEAHDVMQNYIRQQKPLN